MEKQAEGSLEPPTFIRPSRRPSAFSRCMVALVASCLVYYAFTLPGTWFPLGGKTTQPHGCGAADEFSWNTTPSKPYLEYRQCYNSFQCARLELPMDYWNGTTNATVSIAIIKQPAAVPVTHPQYGGAVLHNPGGPGGSGVGFLLGAGETLRDIVGAPGSDGLQYDHISFDPRGIAFTTPNVACFDDPAYMMFWFARTYEEGVYSSSDAAFGRLWSMAAAQEGSCSLPPPDGEADIKQYVNTAFVARDMLEIVERHGQWREAEARRLLGGKHGRVGRKGAEISSSDAEVLDALKHRPGEERINYWGFSYGTYLGNTFAAMFPDRVNRLIVDGVVDAYDYRKTLWLDNLVDTEKDLDLFYYHCARVGYPKCKLASQTGKTTVDSVKERVENISASLYHNPLPLIYYDSPNIITYSDIKGLLFSALYSPLAVFPIVADLLHEIETGSYDASQGFKSRWFTMAKMLGVGATTSIACSDGESLNDVTKEEFREYLKELEGLSPNLGEIWASLRLSCVHYKVRAHYRFTDDWVGNTSHPIMEIGNTADPVTPGRYAKKMAKGFEGAVALIQDSPGHCSLAAPSNCTRTYINRYFQTGELPEEGTVCPADELPFGAGEDDEEQEVLTLEAQKLRQQQRTLSEAFYGVNGFEQIGMIRSLL